MPDTAALSAPPVQTVRLDDGLTVGYRELGSGPAVLLLHGWPTSSYLWRGVMPAIARTNRVVALDMPGFGASDKPLDVRYDFELFERAIHGLLAALRIDLTAVAGHDLGGPIALDWAIRHPERLTRIALLNTLVYPDFDPSVIEFVTTLATPDKRGTLTSPEGLAGIMREGVADEARLTGDAIANVQAPFASPDAQEALALAGIGLQPERFPEIAAALPALTVPFRIVYGDADTILPDVAETMARIARDVPHTELTALPGRGHFLQEEAPEEVGELLAAFFAPRSG